MNQVGRGSQGWLRLPPIPDASCIAARITLSDRRRCVLDAAHRPCSRRDACHSMMGSTCTGDDGNGVDVERCQSAARPSPTTVLSAGHRRPRSSAAATCSDQVGRPVGACQRSDLVQGSSGTRGGGDIASASIQDSCVTETFAVSDSSAGTMIRTMCPSLSDASMTNALAGVP